MHIELKELIDNIKSMFSPYLADKLMRQESNNYLILDML